MQAPKHVKQYLIILVLLAIAISSRFVNINTQGILVDETWVVPNTSFYYEDTSIFPKLFTYEHFLRLSPEKREFIRKIYDLHPLVQIAALHAASDLHPPLFFFLNYYWGRWFGYGVGTIRAPASIYFMLTIILLLFILKKQNIPFEGIVMILSLVILSPIYLFFSNFARPYTLLMFLSLLSSYLSYRLVLNDFQKSNTVYYVISATACLYTHYYGVIVVASQVIYMLTESLFVQNRRHILRIIRTGAGIVLLFLPALLTVVLKAKLSVPSPGQSSFDYISLRNLLELVLSFGLGYSFSTLYSGVNIVVSGLLFAFFIMGCTYLWGARYEVTARFWLCFLVYPLFLIICLNTWKPVFTVRNCLVLLIPYLAITGFGLYSVRSAVLKISASIFMGSVGLFFIFHGLVYGNVKGSGAMEDWRSTASFVKTMDNSLPVYVYHQSYRDALYYYIPDMNRIRAFPDKLAKEGLDDQSYILVLVKPENPSFKVERKIEKELPFLKDSARVQAKLLQEFPRIYVYEVDAKRR